MAKVLKSSHLSKKDYRVDTGVLRVKDAVFNITSDIGDGSKANFNVGNPSLYWDKPSSPKLNASAHVLFNDGVGNFTFNGTDWQLNFFYPTIAGGYLEDTYVNWNTKRLANELPVGSFIKITDPDEADLGVIVRVVSGNTVDPNGIAGFLNADFGVGGDYTDVEDFVSQEGVWRAADILDYEIGDVVIWDNNHYKVIALPLDETQPNASDNFDFLSRGNQLDGDKLGYIEQWDQVVYDIYNDQILWRMDVLGNKINRESIPNFQWGDFNTGPVVQHNIFNTINTLNNTGYIAGVDNGIGTDIDASVNNGLIYFSINGVEQNVFIPENTGTIELNLNGFMNGVFGPGNSGFVKTYLYNNSFLDFVNNSGDVISRHYDASYSNFSDNEGSIYHAEVAKGCNVQIALQNGQFHEYCKYAALGSYEFPNDISYSNKELSNTGSTFDADLSVDVDGVMITPPNYAGLIKLSTSLEAMVNITNIDSQQPTITFKKDSDQSFNFVHNIDKQANYLAQDRTLYVNEIDSITYKKNSALNVWIENHYITFD